MTYAVSIELLLCAGLCQVLEGPSCLQLVSHKGAEQSNEQIDKSINKKNARL